MIKQLLITIIYTIATSSSAIAASDDWVMNYYRSPSPERFVQEVKQLSSQGVLANKNQSNLIGVFLSRVLQSNQKDISAWMEQLKELPRKDLDTLHMALWLSDSEPAKSYLSSIGKNKLVETAAPNILEYKPDSPAVLDMWWAYFFATGSKEPIEKIISAFNHSKYDGAAESFKRGTQTDQAMQEAAYDITFQSARWSLESNVTNHKLVAEIADSILWSSNLTDSEALWLGAVLVKSFPDKYRLTKVDGGQKVEKIQ